MRIVQAPMTSNVKETLRPSELVMRHIEGLRARAHDETRLPTVREMAKLLGVGSSTVSLVYRSLSDQGRIRTEVGNGSFLLPLTKATRKSGRESLQIGIGLEPHDLDDPQGWRSRVYGGLTMGALRIGQQCTLVALYIDAADLESRVRSLDAVVIMPGYLLHRPLLEAADKAGIPTVYLNPPKTGHTQNFVSPDYAGVSEELGRAFLAGGRKNVVMLLSDPWNLMISAHYRMSGLLAGLDYGRNDTQFRIEVAHGFEVEDGRRAMRRMLRHNPRPDAIYTSGDFLAMGCVEELEAQGFSVPGDVSVVGGSGLNLEKYSHPQLTCCAQPYEEIGAELIKMILGLLEAPSQKLPGVIIPMSWVGGASTSKIENDILLR